MNTSRMRRMRSQLAVAHGDPMVSATFDMGAHGCGPLGCTVSICEMINTSSPKVDEVAAVDAFHTSECAFPFWKEVSPYAPFAPLLTL